VFQGDDGLLWATANAAFFAAPGFCLPPKQRCNRWKRAPILVLVRDAARAASMRIAGPGCCPCGDGLATFTGRFVVARGQPGPRGQVLGGRESGHIDADLGNDHGRDAFADPGDTHQQLDLRGERVDQPRHPVFPDPPDLLLDLGQHLVEMVDTGQVQGHHLAVVVGEPPPGSRQIEPDRRAVGVRLNLLRWWRSGRHSGDICFLSPGCASRLTLCCSGRG
jgi:hypothetical protein